MSIHMTKKIHAINLAPQLPRQQNGFNLVELMVAVVLGIFLVLGVTNILFSDQQSFNTSNELARVQENGYLAKNMLANDLKRARYMGADTDLNSGILLGTLGPQDPAPSCETGNTSWARMVKQGLFGLDEDNNQVIDSDYDCITNLNNVPGSYVRGDILTVRFASPWEVTNFENSRLYIRSSLTSSWIFTGEDNADLSNDEIAVAGTPPDPLKSTHELIAYSYYIGNSGRTDCTGQAVPSLFRVSPNNAGQPVSEELFPGIEDFQVQFSLDGVNYINANAVVDWDDVIATQFWLLARSKCEEMGFIDNDGTRRLAGKIRPAPGDGFRRGLYSSIVSHRNIR
jgi:type IV pilus assembly protein PilW